MALTNAPGAIDAVVIGAGPAGLATSRELKRRGVNHVVLERGARVGHTWNNLYDGLVLHTGKHLSSLPGLPFPASTPLFPTRRDFVDYLNRYAERFDLPVRPNADAGRVTQSNGMWNVALASGTDVCSRVLVVATGIVSNPCLPDIPHQPRFRGRIFHSVEYRRPEGYKGQRILVVGAGNSSAEISAELARGGADVTVAIRSGARVVPLQLFGVPIQYVAATVNWLPRRTQRQLAAMIARLSEVVRGRAVLPPPIDKHCPDVPLIGFDLVEAVRAGTIRIKGGIAEFTANGARFSDGSESPFDHVIFATGYKAAVGILGDLIRVDECGFAARHSRVVSADRANLYFVGHNYDVRGGLRNIALDARRAAKTIASQLS
jgi:cation diffusion facilitator CzcD-associated flavoprotein CzcO